MLGDMEPTGTLLIDRRTLASMLSMDEYIELVEGAFAQHGRGDLSRPGLLHIDSGGGAFHIKAGVLAGDHPILATKINGRFPGNGSGSGNGTGAGVVKPMMHGAILVCDGTTGYPLALMDSAEITSRRTGAATAVAAKHLARSDSAVVTVCGTGVQSRAQLRAVQRVLPLERVYIWGRRAGAVDEVVSEMREELGIEVLRAPDLPVALRGSDLCITCTSSTEFLLRRDAVPGGMFIAAVGADSPGKQELEPSLLGAGRLVVDVLEQCSSVGELQHGLRTGVLAADDVYAELGQIVAGLRPGRASRDEITIFDSTGTAFQDAAVAGAAYRRALEAGAGTFFDFFHV
jgi:alanine dehydrogenase